MYYCERCREERDYPRSFTQSQGSCELCGTLAVCYDVPSAQLPEPSGSRPEPRVSFEKLVEETLTEKLGVNAGDVGAVYKPDEVRLLFPYGGTMRLVVVPRAEEAPSVPDDPPAVGDVTDPLEGTRFVKTTEVTEEECALCGSPVKIAEAHATRRQGMDLYAHRTCYEAESAEPPDDYDDDPFNDGTIGYDYYGPNWAERDI